MAKPIGQPLEQTIPLELWDESKETYVTVRQARQQAQEKHDNLFAETTRVWNTGDERVEIKQRVSSGEVLRTEAYLTVIDCNVVDDNGDSVFKFKRLPSGRTVLDMTPAQFEEAWGELPIELADEIHSAVRMVNPQWGPGGKVG